MQLLSIELKNFRQYEHEKISFSTQPDKNVTLIIGESGAGKTTVEQAFMFVLYSVVNFREGVLLNNKVEDRMKYGDTARVSVTLDFIQSNKQYRIEREVQYVLGKELTKSNNGFCGWKLEEGNYKPIVGESLEILVNSLIPYHLAEYFFLTNEKVTDLNFSLYNTSEKLDQFRDVVSGILGLEYIQNSLEHLGKGKYCVISQFEDVLDKSGDETQRELSSLLDKKTNDLLVLKRNLGNIEDRIKTNQKIQTQYENEIARFPLAAEYQVKYREAEMEMAEKTQTLQNLNQNFQKNIGINFVSYLSQPLIKKSLEFLHTNHDVDFGIPELEGKTVEYLLANGRCICGVDLNKDLAHRKALEDLIQLLPPNSLGTSINSFIKESRIKNGSSNNVYDTLMMQYKIRKDSLKSIRRIEADLKKYEELLTEIREVEETKKKLNEVRSLISDFNSERDEDNKKSGALEAEINTLSNKLDSLRLKTSGNEKTKMYLKVSREVQRTLDEFYKKRESEVRKALQDKINYFMNKIYKEGFTIKIDEKYRINTTVDKAKIGSKIEQSRGQGDSIIFAFISSLVSLAKAEKLNKNSGENLNAEFYPLVMDAPLANIGSSVISNFCKYIPGEVEQLVLFLNEKDGGEVKKYIPEKIGLEYLITATDLLESHIKEVENNVR